MSSHREAPAISKDAVADSTDLYAFVSPDDPSTVTIIANYLPGEAPFGGPNFYEFADDVLYRVNIDNDADGKPEIVYEFQFRTEVSNKATFLYNIGPITSLDSANWIRKQFYTVTRVAGGKQTVLGRNLPCPPCNIGPGSTSNYESLASAAVHKLGSGHTVFAGQRLDPFYVDLGSIFDLGDLRPLNKVGPLKLAATHGVDSLSQMNVQSIALRIPKTALTSDGSNPGNPAKQVSVIGVWTSASRRKSVIHNGDGTTTQTGPYVQVSRLGNPLVNEAVIPMAFKDAWNSDVPAGDSEYAKFVANPELQSLLNVLYKGAFPNLAALASSGKPRADLEAVLLTGLPSGVVSGFQNSTGKHARRPVAAEHGDRAEHEAQRRRPGLRRRRRLSEWPPAGRRRRHDHPACSRRPALPADRQDLQGRCGGVARRRRPGPEQQRVPVALPLPRDAVQRLRHEAARGVEIESPRCTRKQSSTAMVALRTATRLASAPRRRARASRSTSGAGAAR